MTDFSEVPGVDITVPNAARMYDFYLGGSHNFAADRAAARYVADTFPGVLETARANRAYLGRAVRWCQERGIDQFLDLGSGIPTVGNVHEVARQSDPSVRVAYVDNEPVTVACSAQVLADDPLCSITGADLTRPDDVFAADGVAGLLDLSRPVALLTVAVLHFLPDEADPAGITARYRARLAPGSVHVLSHGTNEGFGESADRGAATYRNTANPVHLRSEAEIRALLGDTELVEPGLVDLPDWRPESPRERDAPHTGILAGVGQLT